MNTVCWVLPDIGHYHRARMDAAARHGAWKTVVLELFDRSAYAEFKAADAGQVYTTSTLFPGKDAQTLDRSQVVAAIRKGLQEIRPDVVCVSGWADSAALATLEWSNKNNIPAVLFSESQTEDHPRSRWKESLKRRLVRLCSAALVPGPPSPENCSAVVPATV